MSPTFVRLSALLVLAGAVIARPAARACTGTISSLDDVDDAVECATVNINSFTVPAGKTFNLDLADGATVNMRALSSYRPAAHPKTSYALCLPLTPLIPRIRLQLQE